MSIIPFLFVPIILECMYSNGKILEEFFPKKPLLGDKNILLGPSIFDIIMIAFIPFDIISLP